MKTKSKGKAVLFVASSVLYTIGTGVQILFAVLIGRFIDNAIAADFQMMVRNGIILLALLGSYLIVTVGGYCLHALYTKRSLVQLKSALLQSFFHRRTKDFLQKDDSYYINLLNADADILRAEYYGNLPFLLACIAQACFAAIAILLINEWMFVASLMMAILPLLVTNFFTKGLQKRRDTVSRENEAFLNIAKESVQGYEVIKSVGKVDIWQKGVDSCTQKQQKASAAQFVFSLTSNQSIRSVTGFMQLIAIGFAGYLIATGNLTAGALFSITSLITDISAGVNNFVELLNSVRSVKGIMHKVNREIKAPESNAGNEINPTEVTNTEICYKNLDFGFDGKPLLSNFSYCFEDGKCYVVVGESGSGKTSMMKLLLKYYDDYKGSISIFGRNVADLSENTVNRWIGVVNQTPYLFNRSLYFNVMLSEQEDPSMQAQYHELLEKLNLKALAQRVGEQVLGDFGDNISGGERQRICIARALVNKPRILIFDEPTSALDPENKSQIMDLIFSISNVTRIVISHDWGQDFLDRFDGVIRIDSNDERSESSQIGDNSASKG